MNIKQEIMELCDSMIAFWQQLKKKVDAIPKEGSVELVCKWYDYFQEHSDTIGKLSNTKYDIEEVKNHLLMTGELKYEE